MRYKMITFYLGLSFLLEPALAFAAKTTYIYTDRKFHFVKRVELKKKELKERGEANHPYGFDELQLKNMLGDLHFSHKLILKEEVETKEVFNKLALDFLVPHLVEAFKNTMPQEEVVFSLITASRALVFQENRLTLAEAWIKDNFLHIRFRKLMAKIDLTKYDKFADVSKAINRARGLHIDLELKPGQEYGDSTEEVLLSLTKTQAVGKPGVSSTVAEPALSSGIETRLKELENLKEKSLITEEEYEAKRKEILSDL